MDKCSESCAERQEPCNDVSSSVFDDAAMMHILVSRLIERRRKADDFETDAVDLNAADLDFVKDEINCLMGTSEGRQFILTLVEEERIRALRHRYGNTGFDFGETLAAIAVCLAIPFILWLIVKVAFNSLER